MQANVTFTPAEAEIATALFETIFPADETGAGATGIGVLDYVDRALGEAYADHAKTYRAGLAALDRVAQATIGTSFVDGTPRQRRALVRGMQRGNLKHFDRPDQREFFSLVRTHVQEGLFADPLYGGNRDKAGWRLLGHPGVWLENSQEEQLSPEPVTKGGVIQSLADLDWPRGANLPDDPPLPNFDSGRGAEPPAADCDVVIVGVGGVGGFIAPILAEAGLRVVGLEAGPYRRPTDFVPDELGSAYYCRQNMGSKFMAEEPRWRTSAGAPTQAPTYSLGRMMNSVGGSIIHYGAWLRRYHPHHLRYRSHVVERWGEAAIPEGCTVADWPIDYDELRPYFTRVEREVGVAGGDRNPHVQFDEPLPLPPTRPFRLGELFSEAATSLGLHPHPAPVGFTTAPYNGFPASTYSAWNNGFGAWNGEKWHPGLTSVPKALASGNFDLRTGCRVTRVVTDADGRASGVEYVDPAGNARTQRAGIVILAAYTWENVRLMALSGDAKHPDGLGNGTGQLGRHLMTKNFPHVDGFFPDIVFNRHAGPAAQAIVMDDFVSADFDAFGEGGFIGGATLGAENQMLPIQIARETLPPDVPSWGAAYKAHLLQWQHWGVCRLQPDSLPYADHVIDLDPDARDRSPLGLPVVRVTYRLRENEQRQAAYFEAKAAEILRAMGAAKTWAGPAFTGIGSSHDLGGCRAAEDAAAGVTDREMRVHDTLGLYVFGGAVFPTCPGINPTLTLWAWAAMAAERLVARLRGGVEP